VDKGNEASFIDKAVKKLKARGKAAYFKWKKFRCPFCTTKTKPRDGLFEHLLSHARDTSIRGEDRKIRAEHAALLKVLIPT